MTPEGGTASTVDEYVPLADAGFGSAAVTLSDTVWGSVVGVGSWSHDEPVSPLGVGGATDRSMKTLL